MKKFLFLLLFNSLLVSAHAMPQKKVQTFPDGSPIPSWFADTARVDVNRLGKQYVITAYGAGCDSTQLQTAVIQAVIDRASAEGGGVVVIPKGTFLTGSLFFKPGTHLHLVEGAVLKGLDDIRAYQIVKTRLEGQNLDYFAALINADKVDGFTISGKGTINGNGRRFWEEFWLRRKVNRQCTNLEALRPRLIYISNSNDVTVSDVHLINPGFWNNHLYRCNRVKYLGCTIYAPADADFHAPSSDALDLDVCNEVLIRSCFIHCGDDAVCLKGGKGTFVDQNPDNGANSKVIVEHCRIGRAGSAITFGSESFSDRNVILRDCHLEGTNNIVLFKMRPDTPQTYEYVRVENITGMVRCGIRVNRWTQFYDLKKRDDMPRSGVNHVLMRGIKVHCTDRFYDVNPSDKYDLTDFTFEHIQSTDVKGGFDTSCIKGCIVKDVVLNNQKID